MKRVNLNPWKLTTARWPRTHTTCQRHLVYQKLSTGTRNLPSLNGNRLFGTMVLRLRATLSRSWIEIEESLLRWVICNYRFLEIWTFVPGATFAKYYWNTVPYPKNVWQIRDVVWPFDHNYWNCLSRRLKFKATFAKAQYRSWRKVTNTSSASVLSTRPASPSPPKTPTGILLNLDSVSIKFIYCFY